MSINVKRRIFRSDRQPSMGLGRPRGRVTVMVSAVGLLAISGLWATLGPSEAPASAAPLGQIAVDAMQVDVIDGGTLRLRDRVVQLAGVQPPERGLACTAIGGGAMDCGTAAAHALAALIGGRSVDCTLRGAGRGGRPLALCTANGAELNRGLILAGWARGDATVPALREAEDQARADRRGFWGNQRGSD